MLDLLLDPAFLASVPRFLTPLLLAALGGAICERAGVFNIGLEGMILTGAFAAVVGAYFAGSPYVGALSAAIAGLAMGVVFAEFNLRRGGDAIVVSIAINWSLVGICFLKGKLIWGVLGLYLPPIAIVTACRLARPTSWWARNRYEDQPDKLERSKRRYKGEEKVVKPETLTPG